LRKNDFHYAFWCGAKGSHDAKFVLLFWKQIASDSLEERLQLLLLSNREQLKLFAAFFGLNL